MVCTMLQSGVGDMCLLTHKAERGKDCQKIGDLKQQDERHSRMTSRIQSRTRNKFFVLFKRVVPKGLDHTLSVIVVSLYVCVCNVVLTKGGGEPHWLKMISDHH